MGVSSSGKSTIGQAVAEALSLPFFDADDYHPESNLQKMKEGHALNDEDRWPWLDRLNTLSKEAMLKEGGVIACSALKQSYRDKLESGIEKSVKWFYLKGEYELILARMKKRNHFMPPSLLKSQFETLEAPSDAHVISIEKTKKEMIDQILNIVENG